MSNTKYNFDALKQRYITAYEVMNKRRVIVESENGWVVIDKNGMFPSKVRMKKFCEMVHTLEERVKNASRMIPKEELDAMTKQEIESYRINFLAKCGGRFEWKGSDELRYVEELNLYEHLRFKDDVYAKFERWKVSDDKNIASIFNGIDNDVLYNLAIDSFKQKYGKPKYILVAI